MRPQAYISYSWQAEKQTPIIPEIERLCRERGVDLMRDLDRIKYADSIPNFMRQIGSARWVFVVLSPGYFKSPYCMYELLGVFSNKQLDKRVLPVLASREWLDDNNRVSLLNELGAHWKSQSEADLAAALKHQTLGNEGLVLDAVRKAEFVVTIKQRMAEFIAYFANLNLPASSPANLVHVMGLVARIPKTQTIRPDAEFVGELKARIARVLSIPEVEGAIKRVWLDSTMADSPSLIAESALDPESVIDTVLIPAFRQLRAELGPSSNRFGELWEQACRLLGWMLVLSVREQWVTESGPDPEADRVFEIPSQTEFGIELVSARVRQHVSLPLASSPGNPVVRPTQAFTAPDLPEGWGDGNGVNPLALARIKVAIWDVVFHEAKKSTPVELSSSELKILDETLSKRLRAKTYHYYLRIALPTDTANSRRALCAKLAEELPSLPIIFMTQDDNAAQIFIGSETGLMSSAREFFSIHQQP